MDFPNYPLVGTSEDIRKLHAESLQLRNQQFLLSTVGMTAVGLSSWFIPKPSGDAAQDAAHAVATLFLLLLLVVLFTWSIFLRRLISTISQYLELRRASEWEFLFRDFSRHKGTTYRSQSVAVAWLYLVLGGVVVANYFVLACSRSTTLWNGYTYAVLGMATALGFVIAFLTLSRRRYDDKARANWITTLNTRFPASPAQGAAPTAADTTN